MKINAADEGSLSGLIRLMPLYRKCRQRVLGKQGRQRQRLGRFEPRSICWRICSTGRATRPIGLQDSLSLACAKRVCDQKSQTWSRSGENPSRSGKAISSLAGPCCE